MLLIALAPLLLVELPPLNDYPSNLARAYILNEHARSAWLQTYYVPMLTLQPNLAMDLAVIALAQLMPIEVAGKVFVAVTIVLISSGPIVLHRAVFGHWSLWPCAAILFVYNRLFLWGFLGFLSTLGLMFFVLAAYVFMRDRAGVVARSLATACGAFVMLIGHMFVLGALGLIVGSWEIHRQFVRWQSTGRWSIVEPLGACLPLLAPVALFTLFSPAADAAGETGWSAFSQRLQAIYYVIGNYSVPLDVFSLAALGCLMAWLLFRRYVVVHGGIATAVLVLAGAQLVMPEVLFGSGYGDRRLPLVIVLLGLAGMNWTFRASHPVRQRVLAGLAILFIARTGMVLSTWLEADRIYASWLAAIDRLPTGARLLHLRFDTKYLVPAPVDHIESMAIIRRQTLAPKLFAYPLHRAHAIAFAPPYDELHRLTPQPSTTAPTFNAMMERVYYRDLFGEEYQDCYEYVIVSAPPGMTIDPGPGFKAIERGAGFVLYATRSAGKPFDQCWMVHRPDARSFASRYTYGW